MKALIFNSGLGNRMGEITKAIHKSMVSLHDNESIMHRQLRILRNLGISQFVITTGPFEEQLRSTAADFRDLEFTFVRNDIYYKTNYIYSMYLARDFINDDLLILHGDLVFSHGLAQALISSQFENCAPMHFTRELPGKDFKARERNGKILEVSISIFDDDCKAFQPFYKLQKAAASAWIGKVAQFVHDGQVTCYAENALNEILPALDVKAIPYDEHYIDEIDTSEDHIRVREEIIPFDMREKISSDLAEIRQ